MRLLSQVSNPMASLRRSSLSLCTIDDATPEWIPRLWRTLSSEDYFVFEFVWLIRWLFWPMIVNVFVLFTNVELSFSCSCSWLKGEPPGTRTLAAGCQKKMFSWISPGVIPNSVWGTMQAKKKSGRTSFSNSWGSMLMFWNIRCYYVKITRGDG